MYLLFGNENIFFGVVYVYLDMWIVVIFNFVCVIWMVFMLIIVWCVVFLVWLGDYWIMVEYVFVVRMVSSVVSEVIVSVLYYFGYFLLWKDKRGNLIENSFNGRGLGGYFLMWLLVCVVIYDYVIDVCKLLFCYV